MDTPPDRVAGRVGGCAPAAAREGEGADPRPGCDGCRASADAVDGRGEGVRVRWARGQGQPGRPLRGSPAADRLPRLLRARRLRLARARLCRVLDGGRPSRPRRPPERPRHHARVCLAGAADGHRAREGADGLGDALVHVDRRLRRGLRRGRVARHERIHPRWRPRVPDLLHQRLAATRRWGAPGATSTSRRSGARRSGRTRQRATPRPRRTSGGSGTTNRPKPTPIALDSCSSAPPGPPRRLAAPRDRARRRRARGRDPAAAVERGGRRAPDGARAWIASRLRRPRNPHDDQRHVAER